MRLFHARLTVTIHYKPAFALMVTIETRIHTMLHPGLYEQVINKQLDTEITEIAEARKSVAPIDKADASKVLSQ